MANSYLSTQTGQPELKDYYDQYGSVYEALKRKRKKAAEKIVSQENESEFDKVPNPER